MLEFYLWLIGIGLLGIVLEEVDIWYASRHGGEG